MCKQRRERVDARRRFLALLLMTSFWGGLLSGEVAAQSTEPAASTSTSVTQPPSAAPPSTRPSATPSPTPATTPPAPVVVPLKYHPWAAFSPGAWKCVRVITDTYNEDGSLVSTGVTETTTTLKKVEKDGVTLEMEVAVWVAGNRLDPQPQTFWQGLFGQSADQKVALQELRPEELSIEGRSVPCCVRQVEISGPNGKPIETVKIFHNDNVPPFILCRRSVASEGDGGSRSKVDMEVDALDMPIEVNDRILSAAHTRSVHRHGKGVTLTLAYTSDEVPGGIIAQQSKELDTQGHLVRRSVLQMLAYGLEPEEDRGGPLQRRLRSVRVRKGLRGSSD